MGVAASGVAIVEAELAGVDDRERMVHEQGRLAQMGFHVATSYLHVHLFSFNSFPLGLGSVSEEVHLRS